MPDPLSIATGAFALLQVTVKVANELKKFHDGVTVVNTTIALLTADVESLTRVLESMRHVFEGITAEHGTGHIATLWDNVARSIEDGTDVLRRLNSLVQDISVETKFLDAQRKQLRLNRSEDRISGFRIYIHSYRDGLQLSLQAVILWNQMTFQSSAQNILPNILPNLIELHNDVRRIAHLLNERIELLQTTARSNEDETQVVAMSNLRECVKAAASTISSSSTVITSGQEGDNKQTIAASNFGDCFPPEDNLAMRRWMESRTVYEYEEINIRPPESVADVPAALEETDGGSDSDADLENEMTRLLLKSSKQKLSEGNSKAAEKMLRNCLGRLAVTRLPGREEVISLRLDVVEDLYQIYLDQERWSEAQDMLSKKMGLQERFSREQDSRFFTNVMSLATLMLKQDDTPGATLHARRALKGFKKLHDPSGIKSSLSLLIEICEASGNEDDAEAYNIMMENLESGNARFAPPLDGKPPIPLPPSPPETLLLRPHFSSPSNIRPTTSDSSSDEGTPNKTELEQVDVKDEKSMILREVDRILADRSIPMVRGLETSRDKTDDDPWNDVVRELGQSGFHASDAERHRVSILQRLTDFIHAHQNAKMMTASDNDQAGLPNTVSAHQPDTSKTPVKDSQAQYIVSTSLVALLTTARKTRYIASEDNGSLADPIVLLKPLQVSNGESRVIRETRKIWDDEEKAALLDIGAPANLDDLERLIDHPNFSQHMRNAMENPEVLKCILECPQIRNNAVALQAIHDPAFLQSVTSPEALRTCLLVQRAMSTKSEHITSSTPEPTDVIEAISASDSTSSGRATDKTTTVRSNETASNTAITTVNDTNEPFNQGRSIYTPVEVLSAVAPIEDEHSRKSRSDEFPKPRNLPLDVDVSKNDVVFSKPALDASRSRVSEQQTTVSEEYDMAEDVKREIASCEPYEPSTIPRKPVPDAKEVSAFDRYARRAMQRLNTEQAFKEQRQFDHAKEGATTTKGKASAAQNTHPNHTASSESRQSRSRQSDSDADAQSVVLESGDNSETQAVVDRQQSPPISNYQSKPSVSIHSPTTEAHGWPLYGMPPMPPQLYQYHMPPTPQQQQPTREIPSKESGHLTNSAPLEQQTFSNAPWSTSPAVAAGLGCWVCTQCGTWTEHRLRSCRKCGKTVDANDHDTQIEIATPRMDHDESTTASTGHTGGITHSASTPSLPLNPWSLIDTDVEIADSRPAPTTASSSTLVATSTSSRAPGPDMKRKLVIVGDSICGKTALLIRFSKGVVVEYLSPTTFDDWTADVEVDGHRVKLSLCDTSGADDYDRFRPLWYPDSHVVLICFSIDNPDGLDNVQEKWISEVLHFCRGLPIFLIGTKADLRNDQKTIEELQRTLQHPVTREEAQEVRRKIGAQAYIECSAVTNEGVKEVFETAVRAAMLVPDKKKRRSVFRFFKSNKV